jgi:hypothetical protein
MGFIRVWVRVEVKVPTGYPCYALVTPSLVIALQLGKLSAQAHLILAKTHLQVSGGLIRGVDLLQCHRTELASSFPEKSLHSQKSKRPNTGLPENALPVERRGTLVETAPIIPLSNIAARGLPEPLLSI